MFVLLVFTLLIPVCRAEESLFVLKGSSARLGVQRYEELQFYDVSWTFNTYRILWYIKPLDRVSAYGDYVTRTEFDRKNFSLLLKNVQHNDSGIYTANIYDTEGQQRDVATYRLSVQEALPIPQMAVALLSYAGGFCNMSVNCSAKDTWGNYTCDHAHCTQVANTASLTGVNIIVTATNGTIHCSSSNQVDTKTLSKSTKDIFCRVEESLFVLKGSSVRLDVQSYEELQFYEVSWTFNTSRILWYIKTLDRVSAYGDYVTRTEFDTKNFSLLLKNVQHRDSGIYTAEIYDNEGQQRDVATYRVAVQGSGPPVTPSPGLSLCALKSVLFSIGLVAMVSAVITVNVRERCCRNEA